MSDLEKKLSEKKEELEAKVAGEIAKVKRSLAKRMMIWIGWTVAALLVLVVVLFGTFAWYSKTNDFNRRVGKEVVKVLEDATGGRVELAKISFDLWHLAIEADGLVIHGLEGPGEAPYIAVDRVLLRVEIFDFFTHVTGSGISSHIRLNYLDVERPQFHLIVDKDGKTNQPVPKHPNTSKTSVTDTLLDLKAQEVVLSNGVALINNRAIPFDLAARDLDAEVHYLAATDRYGATVELKDLRTKMGKQVEAQSALSLAVELGRDALELQRLKFTTGKSSELDATGSFKNFAEPQWQATVKGTVEIKQISVLADVDGLNAGTVDLDLNGHNCTTSPSVAQKHPPFWRRSHPAETTKPPRPLPPDPDCVAGYLLVGTAKIHKAAYRDQNVRLHDIDGGGTLHVTPTELLLTALTGYLPGGGGAAGELRIANWLGEVPPQDVAVSSSSTKAAITTANTTAKTIGAKAPISETAKVPPVQVAHAYLTAIVTKIPLRTIMDVTAPEDYGDLGFDTAVSGPVKVEWGGPAKNISDTVEVEGNLTFAPTGVRRRGALNDVPVTGQTVAHYTGRNETVLIQRISLQMPETNFEASGILGVNEGDPLTDLRVDMTVRDLSEYNQLLTTLDLEGNGKKGTAAIPVVLHGAMQFNGTAKGKIADLDVKGHLQATNAEFALGTTDVLIDSLVTDAEYSPNTGVVVASSTIKRGTAVLNAEGKIAPRKVVSRFGKTTYLWDDGMALDAKVQLANAQVVDVLQIAGQQEKVSLTGTVALNGHAVGTLRSLSGGGHLSLMNGVAYGEPYESAVADLTVQGKDVEAANVVLRLHGMQIAGNGGYDMSTDRLHGHIEGHDIQLSKFETVKKAKNDVDGTVNLVADANGTLTQPGLKANVTLNAVSYRGQMIGEATVEAHSQGEVMYFTANSTLVGAKLNASGQTRLTGEYQTEAKMAVAGLDIGKPLEMFGPGTMKAQSMINGSATVSGPLKTPKALRGEAEFSQVDVKLQGVELKAAEPLRVGLRDGLATLEQVHITGQDTDMRASGTGQLFGATDPKGGKLDVKATGSVSMTLLHTFDSDVISTGKVEFTVGAGGYVMNPELTGRVQFDKVNVAIDGVPNGLSNMNGTLVFNDDRLQVQSLTATTGGGTLKIGGFIRYKNGLYADLSATGDVVRVRLYGLSATANANLKLQGGPESSLLSGTILITRFGVGADVDFAAFGSAGGVSPPPDPNAPSNKIRLDVHVTSAPQLDFQNSYAKLAGTVDLQIRGTAAVPSLLGRIEINEGSATFAGTKYLLQRGDIYFTNPVRIDPIIDLDATAQVENYDITIGLHGTSTNLKPTYRSEPPLSESDVFALLALGRTQEEAQLYQERQVQQGTDPTTSALLGGALNATVSNRVEKLFGVGSVKIDPAFVGTLGGSSARITVQQQLSRQITATFATNVNTSAQQLIQVQYDLNHDNSIVVARDESGVFSIVYKLRRRYR
ncbi:translocation/assembly module TamB domain-containing protein [Tunturiibacter gelidoferens]|uniref:Translocation and assembly module TamB n=1 Tax=Tunturiibacter gelidiferens TaxID=3069689 RepID=A0ACC5NZ29_9BACT|nr:translocation/assembly module TamB domain-containing protein [Edaphobacter lichenicola]MBB5339701.1 translocation and assembly module TamB [Edaphobacter lichenicola]